MRTDITARVAVTCVRTTLFAGCIALLALSGCAAEGDAADVSGVGVGGGDGRLVQAAPPVGLSVHVPPSVSGSALLGLSTAFDRDAFASEVASAGEEHLPGVASLPSVYVADIAGMEAAVERIVARSSADVNQTADGDTATCNGDPLGCVWSFSHTVAGFNGDLSLALHPAALRLRSVARDLRVTRWTSTEQGVTRDLAVTLHGHIGDQLVGIAVFR